jgi:hypothetical protein
MFTFFDKVHWGVLFFPTLAVINCPISELKPIRMKMKRLIFGILACVTLMAVSCEPNNTADEDQLYEQGVDKTKVVNGDNRK